MIASDFGITIMSKKMERRSQKVNEEIKTEVDEVIGTAKKSGKYYVHVSYIDGDDAIQHFNAHINFNVGNLIPVGNNIDDFLREKIPDVYCQKLRTGQRNT